MRLGLGIDELDCQAAEADAPVSPFAALGFERLDLDLDLTQEHVEVRDGRAQAAHGSSDARRVTKDQVESDAQWEGYPRIAPRL
ncbi:hypothetical protein [Amycolatopsis magusensis]|uniref:Uncharacterized protein n=1 Tax=Amycolatopsis magusensis TaxID=882444 RepID=A0ABS4PM31_9PSEU|nr:hypothetical protein [Amycolatopsis magusensis]MBP2180483.1 hypothetical protein [Amycolatopsis magusensis]